MMKNKILKQISIGAASILLLTACSSTSTKNDSTPATTDSAKCYIATVGNDQARFQFDSPISMSDKVFGILEYRFAQKDRTWGIFSGTVKDGQMNINYQYASEGVVSYRDITYKLLDGDKIEGEGFTFEPSAKCEYTASPYEWSALGTTNVKADTTHDPETGYYARLTYDFTDQLKNVKIRCIGKVSSSDGTEITRWINLGTSGDNRKLTNWIMMTNIKPDQVKSVASGEVSCESAAL